VHLKQTLRTANGDFRKGAAVTNVRAA